MDANARICCYVTNDTHPKTVWYPRVTSESPGQDGNGQLMQRYNVYFNFGQCSRKLNDASLECTWYFHWPWSSSKTTDRLFLSTAICYRYFAFHRNSFFRHFHSGSGGCHCGACCACSNCSNNYCCWCKGLVQETPLQVSDVNCTIGHTVTGK